MSELDFWPPAGDASLPPSEYYARMKSVAVKLRKEKKYAAAARFLEEAMSYWEQNPEQDPLCQPEYRYPPAGCYHDLALRLQEAGRGDDGWAVLRRVLLGQFPQRLSENNHAQKRVSDRGEGTRRLLASWTQAFLREQAETYDKMRLFREREGAQRDAAVLGMMSYATWVLAWEETAPYEERTQRHVEEVTSEEALRREAERNTKKLKDGRLTERFADALLSWCNQVPRASLSDLNDALSDASHAE